MKNFFSVIAAGLLISSVCHPEDHEAARAEKRRVMFAQAKEIRIQGLRDRISLLQEGLSCIQAAQDTEAMGACERKERQAQEELLKRQRDKWSSMRDQVKGQK